MANERLSKFISDQEAAVQIARDASDMPIAYNIRVDAINASLSFANSMRDSTEFSMKEIIANAKLAEMYLKGES